MHITEEIQLNKFGQGLITQTEIHSSFSLLPINEKREYLSQLSFIMLQSKCQISDLQLAIINAGLKETFTSCVMIEKGGLKLNVLEKVIKLPDSEVEKVFLLFINLFKLCYLRRFSEEKNDPNKWWYWDMSIPDNVNSIMNNYS